MVKYFEILPSPNLKNYISCYWCYSYIGNKRLDSNILPDGCFDIIITVQNDRIINTALTGLWDQKVGIFYTEDIELYAIRFKATAIGTLLNFPIELLYNSRSIIELGDFGLDKVSIENILGSNPSGIFDYFNRVFSKSKVYQSGKAIKTYSIFNMIELNKGGISIQNIADELGLSTRQISRIVNSTIGFSPKRYSRIIRFRDYQKNKANTSYYDQSHYYKDLNDFATKKEGDVRILQYNNLKQS